MKKNFFFGMFAATGMLLATSCSNDELIEQTSGDMATVSFNLSTEDALASRAISDGNTATKLYYQVFDGTGNTISGQGLKESTLSNGSGQVTVTLAKGQDYKIAFWAQSANAPYTVETGMAVSLNYTNTTVSVSNMEDFDAFCETIDFECSQTGTQSVILQRPFAQVNVGTTAEDWANAVNSGFTPSKFTAEFTSVATQYNVVTETASVNAAVTFSDFIVPSYNAATGEELLTLKNNKTYRYVATAYVLPAAEEPAAQSESTAQAVVDAEFTFTSTDNKTIVLDRGVSNLPVKSNWRTNIVGQILTATNQFDVVIDPAYEDEQESINVWDGYTLTEPAVIEGVRQINTPAEWAWFAINAQYSSKFAVNADLDFGGNGVYPLAGCSGVIDFGGHTFKNLVMKWSEGHAQSGYSIGFISGDRSGISGVKNLTLENIKAENTVGEYAAAVMGDVQRTMTFENVHVKNATVKGVQSIGGLAGMISTAAGVELTIKNCSVKDSHFSNRSVANESGNIAALVGRPNNNAKFEGTIVVSGNVVNAFYVERRGVASVQAVLGNIETLPKEITAENNQVTKTEVVEADLVIATVEQLQSFAANVKNGNDYSGKTVALSADIDLQDVNFEPIGGFAYNTAFRGTFDGHGYTIKNMVITSQQKYSKTDGTLVTVHSAGFFANLSTGACVKNLNFENANVLGSHWVGVVCGYFEFGTIENCTVNNSRIESRSIVENGSFVDGYDGDKAGGLVGMIAPNIGDATYRPVLKDCVVSNSQVYAVRDAGKGVGMCYLDLETADKKYIVNCSAVNTIVKHNKQVTADNNIGANMDGFVGRKS